jgi:hypothetical protein
MFISDNQIYKTLMPTNKIQVYQDQVYLKYYLCFDPLNLELLTEPPSISLYIVYLQIIIIVIRLLSYHFYECSVLVSTQMILLLAVTTVSITAQNSELNLSICFYENKIMLMISSSTSLYQMFKRVLPSKVSSQTSFFHRTILIN